MTSVEGMRLNRPKVVAKSLERAMNLLGQGVASNVEVGVVHPNLS